MASSVKKDKSRIRIISGINIDMVLMVEMGTRAGMSHAFAIMQKVIVNT